MDSILPRPLKLPYREARKDMGFTDAAQMAYFTKTGWTIDATGAFLEKAGTKTIIVQFKYTVLFLVQFRERYFAGKNKDIPARCFRPNDDKNLVYTCEPMKCDKQWAAIKQKYSDGYTVIYWVHTQPTNKKNYAKAQGHRRRSVPGVFQHYLGIDVSKSCRWLYYYHVFIVAMHKDHHWTIYDNANFIEHHFAHIIKVRGVRPMLKVIGDKLQTYVEPEAGAKRGIVPAGYTRKELKVTRLICDPKKCWACEESCVVYAIYATEFISKHPTPAKHPTMYKCCRNQLVYGLIRAKIEHYTLIKIRGQYEDVEEGKWGANTPFPYDELLHEAMLDESSLGKDNKCNRRQITKKRLLELNERLKCMADIPRQKLDPSYISLLQEYVDERKVANINKLMDKRYYSQNRC